MIKIKESIPAWNFRFYATAMTVALIMTLPMKLRAHSRELAGVIVAGVLLGIPLAIILLILGIIGIVYLIKKRSRPRYALFLIIGPSVAAAAYLLAFAFRPFNEFMGYLTVFIPALFLTICDVIIGIFLRRVG